MIWFIKTSFIAAIVGIGLVFPVFLLVTYFSPWEEAIEAVNEKFPEAIWIPTAAGSSSTISNGQTTRRSRTLSVLILPENETMHFFKEDRNEMIMMEEKGGAASFFIGTAIIYGLFFWQAPKVPDRIKEFLDRKSGYL